MITRFRFLMQLFHTWWGKVQLNYVSISLKRSTMSNRTWHLQVMGSLFHWNTMERNGISENVWIRVHVCVEYTSLVIFISYFPNKLKLPSLFCYFRIGKSVAVPCNWFNWHILLSLQIVQPQPVTLRQLCTKCWVCSRRYQLSSFQA